MLFSLNMPLLKNSWRRTKKIERKQKNIQVRVIKVKLKTGQTEILFTNLPNEIATPEELKQLYCER